MTASDRIVIVSGPRAGKSSLARALRAHGYPTYCGDPIDKVKEVEAGVTYLDAGMGMDSASSRYIVDNWLPMPGPWVLEGHIMARVLRKWLEDAEASGSYEETGFPCDRIIVFPQHHPHAEPTKGQRALHKGVIEKTWRDIEGYFDGMTEVVDWRDDWCTGLTPEMLADVLLKTK